MSCSGNSPAPAGEPLANHLLQVAGAHVSQPAGTCETLAGGSKTGSGETEAGTRGEGKIGGTIQAGTRLVVNAITLTWLLYYWMLEV